MTTTVVFSTRSRNVGCARDAQAALNGALPFVDSGLFKRVYRDAASRVVYKVSRGAAPNSGAVSRGRANALTAEAAWVAFGREQGLEGIPHVTLYVVDGEPVLAMPFITHASEDLYEIDDYAKRQRVERRGYDVRATWMALGMDDIHGGNWRYDGRWRPVIVDLGGWGDTAPYDSLPAEARDVVSSMDDPDDEHDDYCECDECCHDPFNCCSCGNHDNCGDCGYCYNCEWAEHDGECNQPIIVMCNEVGDGWVCVRDKGHLGSHESVTNMAGVPFHTWLDAPEVMCIIVGCGWVAKVDGLCFEHDKCHPDTRADVNHINCHCGFCHDMRRADRVKRDASNQAYLDNLGKEWDAFRDAYIPGGE